MKLRISALIISSVLVLPAWAQSMAWTNDSPLTAENLSGASMRSAPALADGKTNSSRVFLRGVGRQSHHQAALRANSVGGRRRRRR